jgi:hypothetical protein
MMTDWLHMLQLLPLHASSSMICKSDSSDKYVLLIHYSTPGGGGYGQNIANTGSTASDVSSEDPSILVPNIISNMWYNGELPYFQSEFGKPSPDMSLFSKWGHFTQVVWKGTGRVGCATHFCASGTPMFTAPYSGWFTVCNYAGPGKFPRNFGQHMILT